MAHEDRLGEGTADDSEQYWAREHPDDLAATVIDKFEEYYEAIRANGMAEVWARAYAAYYGLSMEGAGHMSSQVSFYGVAGERVFAKSNQVRSIVRYIVNTITGNRPHMEPRAANYDYDTMAQIAAARSWLDHVNRNIHGEERLGSAFERSLLYGRGYVVNLWDHQAGEDVEAMQDEEGEYQYDVFGSARTVRTGEPSVQAYSPWDVAHDTTMPASRQQWYILREPVNRYDAAVRYPEVAEDILNLEPDEESPDMQGWGLSPGLDRGGASDLIYLYHFVHDRSPSLPDGRYMKCFSADLWVTDGSLFLPSLEHVVVPLSPEEFLETPYGYTSVWDLLALQELYDSALSIMITNMEAFGVQNIVLPEGAEVGVEELRDGLNLIRYPQGFDKPEVLDLMQIPEVIFKLREIFKTDMETTSGVNSVARGSPEGGLKSSSGAALALVQAQAIQFNNGAEATYFRAIERFGTAQIKLAKAFAKYPRVIEIVGEDERGRLEEFMGNRIRDIDRIVVDAGNPLMRNIYGRRELADKFMDKGLIKHPSQYWQVFNTGRLEPVHKYDSGQGLRIKQENEKLRKSPPLRMDPQTGQPAIDPQTGQPAGVDGVPVLLTDDHPFHIREHAADMDDTALENPEAVEARTVHIMEHMRVWRNADPDLLAALGIPPLQNAAAQGPAEPPQGEGGPRPPEDKGGQAPPASSGQPPPPPQPPPAESAGPETTAPNVDMPNQPSASQDPLADMR